MLGAPAASAASSFARSLFRANVSSNDPSHPLLTLCIDISIDPPIAFFQLCKRLILLCLLLVAFFVALVSIMLRAANCVLVFASFGLEVGVAHFTSIVLCFCGSAIIMRCFLWSRANAEGA